MENLDFIFLFFLDTCGSNAIFLFEFYLDKIWFIDNLWTCCFSSLFDFMPIFMDFFFAPLFREGLSKYGWDLNYIWGFYSTLFLFLDFFSATRLLFELVLKELIELTSSTSFYFLWIDGPKVSKFLQLSLYKLRHLLPGFMLVFLWTLWLFNTCVIYSIFYEFDAFIAFISEHASLVLEVLLPNEFSSWGTSIKNEFLYDSLTTLTAFERRDT